MTAIGVPDCDSRRETSSAFELWRGKASSPPRPVSSRPLALAAALPFTTSSLRTLPRSGRTERGATALPEDPADQARGGDRVRDLPVIRPRLSDRGVLARHLEERVRARLGDVAVDSGHVVRDVVLKGRA